MNVPLYQTIIINACTSIKKLTHRSVFYIRNSGDEFLHKYKGFVKGENNVALNKIYFLFFQSLDFGVLISEIWFSLVAAVSGSPFGLQTAESVRCLPETEMKKYIIIYLAFKSWNLFFSQNSFSTNSFLKQYISVHFPNIKMNFGFFCFFLSNTLCVLFM